MRTLELFCGTKSFSRVAESRGHHIFTVDFDDKFEPDRCTDIMYLHPSSIPFKPDVIWASPPCTCFSVASIGKHWYKNNTPKTKEAQEALQILYKTIEFIRHFGDAIYFIENPRGKMRKIDIMNFLPRRKTITYCQYGDTRMKPTDIWTNNLLWKPKPACKNGDACHVSAPRGSRTGSQGMSKIESARVPIALCSEVLQSCEDIYK
jgi:hypothetical protein